jgi:hypothetical protein
MLKVKQKTIDCMKHIAVGFEDMELRRKSLIELDAKYKTKVTQKKLYELSDKGYIEFGGNPVGGWLTPKGKEFMRMLEAGEVVSEN